MNIYNTVIILTACVNPNGMTATKLQNTNIRANQYKNALSFYLKNTPYRILFIENTLYDFSNDFIEYIENGRLEYLTYQGNDYTRSLGKGYGEALILSYAVNHSSFITDSSIIIKITGRIIIENINVLCNVGDISRIKKNPIIACNIRPSKKIGTSTFFICRKIFLTDYFLPHIEDINDSKHVWFEHVLYNAIIESGSKCIIFSRPIKIRGFSGTTSKLYPKIMWYDYVLSYCAAFLHNRFNFMKF